MKNYDIDLIVMYSVHCPYCNGLITVEAPRASSHRALINICEHCHKPIAVYGSDAEAMQHSDRAMRSVSVAVTDGEAAAVLFEVIDNSYAKSQMISIPMGESVLGRYNKDSDADLQVYSSDPSMGRHHIRIWHSQSGVSIADNESNTGTFVNARLLSKGERVRLNDGDVIALGAMSLIVHLVDDDDDDIDLSDFDI